MGRGGGGVAADRGDAEEARPLIEFHQVILFASHLESRGVVSRTLSLLGHQDDQASLLN